MKFLVCFTLMAVVSAQNVPESVDIGNTLVSQLGTFSRQVQGIQNVLSDLNASVNRMIASSTRLVTGLADETGPASIGDNAIQALSQVTNQLIAMQRVMSDLSAQLNRMITSSTRLVAGQSSGEAAVSSISDNAMEALSQVTNQLASMQRVMSDLSAQLNRMISSSTRIVSGQEAGSGSPAEAALATLSQMTAQFAAAQRVLGELNSQLNRMIQSSTRLVAGLDGETTTAAPAGPNPAEAALQAVQQFTQQFAAAQRVLSDLSGQLNRMITTGSRLVAGK